MVDDSFKIVDNQTVWYTAIIHKDDFEDELYDYWVKRGFPYKCYYSEVVIPEKVFDFSSTDPCYPFGRCMLETWGYYDAGSSSPFSFTGDCAEEVYTDDLNGATPNLGYTENPTDSSRECLLEGWTLIEDIEGEPWNVIETSVYFTASSFETDSEPIDADQDLIDDLSDLDDAYTDYEDALEDYWDLEAMYNSIFGDF